MSLSTTTTDKNKIAIIVGAGAVENSWTPILHAFKLIMRREIDIDSANCIFARHIYLIRFYSKFPNPKGYDDLKIEIEQVSIMKEIICNFIKQAQEKEIIKPRAAFASILKKFVFGNPNNLFSLICTNWDTVINNEADKLIRQHYIDLDSAKCFHLHGSITSPNHLYLPSETSLENYRSEKENDKLGYDHYATLDVLKQSNQIILYGLSLDPLDAELSQILNSAFMRGENLREVIIINPDYDRVRKRV